MDAKLTITGMKPLLNALQQMPEVMRTNVLVPAATKAIKTVYSATLPYIPVGSARNRRRTTDRLRNVMTWAVRVLPSGTVFGITGPESGQAPHAHIVERGTKQRFTNSKTRYAKSYVGVRTVIKNGKPVVKAVRKRIAVGTRKKKQSLVQLNRGVMPAFRFIERGANSAKSAVESQLRSDIAAGITRELTESKLQRGAR